MSEGSSAGDSNQALSLWRTNFYGTVNIALRLTLF